MIIQSLPPRFVRRDDAFILDIREVLSDEAVGKIISPMQCRKPKKPSDATWLTLHEVAEQEGVHYLTVRRWCIDGYKGTRLEGFKFGHEWRIAPEALARFKENTTAAVVGAPVSRGRKRREAEIQRAKRKLAKDGI